VLSCWVALGEYALGNVGCRLVLSKLVALESTSWIMALVGWCFRGGSGREVSHTVAEHVDPRVKVVAEVYFVLRDFKSCVR
jgi:hypothetical protein